MWPDSERRETHDGDRLLAAVRGATEAEKAAIIDSLDDRQLGTVMFDMVPAEVERLFWDRVLRGRPRCDVCGYKHWPTDPHETPRGTPSKVVTPPTPPKEES